MLSVDQVYVIRRKVLVDGVGIRRVARELGVSRNTVRKYLGEAEPQRRSAAPRARPVFDTVMPRLSALIEEWTPRTEGKQRLTAARLHQELRAEGLEVGRTLVQEVLRERRRQAAEVYVPLVHHAGDEAQVDFFDVRVDVGGERRRGVAVRAAADVLGARLRLDLRAGRIRWRSSTATCARSRTSTGCRTAASTTISRPRCAGWCCPSAS